MPGNLTVYKSKVGKEPSEYDVMTKEEFGTLRNFEFKEAFCKLPKNFNIPPTKFIDLSSIVSYERSFVLVPMSAPTESQTLELGYAVHYDPKATREIPKDTVVTHYAGELILSKDGRGPYVIEIPHFSELAIDALRIGNIARFFPSLPTIAEAKMFEMPDEIRAKIATENLSPDSYITIDGLIGIVFKTIRAIPPGGIMGFSYYLPYFLNRNTIPFFYTEIGLPLDLTTTFLDIRRYFVFALIRSIFIEVNPLLMRDRSLSLAFHDHPLTQLKRQFDSDINYAFEKFEHDLRLQLHDFKKIISNFYERQKDNAIIQELSRKNLDNFEFLDRILTQSPEAMCGELREKFKRIYPEATNQALFRFKHEIEAKKSSHSSREIGFFEAPILNRLMMKYGLPDYSQPNLEKALRNAATNNNVNDLRTLLKYVKNINAIDGNPTVGRTAFHWACEKGHAECIGLLMQDERLDPNIADVKGWVPSNARVEVSQTF